MSCRPGQRKAGVGPQVRLQTTLPLADVDSRAGQNCLAYQHNALAREHDNELEVAHPGELMFVQFGAPGCVIGIGAEIVQLPGVFLKIEEHVFDAGHILKILLHGTNFSSRTRPRWARR